MEPSQVGDLIMKGMKPGSDYLGVAILAAQSPGAIEFKSDGYALIDAVNVGDILFIPLFERLRIKDPDLFLRIFNKALYLKYSIPKYLLRQTVFNIPASLTEVQLETLFRYIRSRGDAELTRLLLNSDWVTERHINIFYELFIEYPTKRTLLGIATSETGVSQITNGMIFEASKYCNSLYHVLRRLKDEYDLHKKVLSEWEVLKLYEIYNLNFIDQNF